MPEYLRDLETKNADELQRLADELKAKLASYSELPGQKPAEYWTYAANLTAVGEQLKRRAKRRG